MILNWNGVETVFQNLIPSLIWARNAQWKKAKCGYGNNRTDDNKKKIRTELISLNRFCVGGLPFVVICHEWLGRCCDKFRCEKHTE